jgi:hypothetical protein
MKEEKSVQKSITVDGVKNVASNPVAGNMASEVELRVIEDMKKSRIYFEVGEEKKSTEERKLDEKEDSNSRKVVETDWKSKMKQNLGSCWDKVLALGQGASNSSLHWYGLSVLCIILLARMYRKNN